MGLIYQSTRNSGDRVLASQAVLRGLALDGGLYVPLGLNKLDMDFMKLAAMDYKETALYVMKHFLTDYTDDELSECIKRAYDDKFDTPDIAPVKEKDGVYYLELFHGATIAFKDMALAILPHLLTMAARKNNVKEEIVILTATSGDTGKAAMAGFADVKGTKIIVFYPKNGVSMIQEKQMLTQKGNNVYVVGVTGNFDDTQNGVKAMFSDRCLENCMKERGYVFSSANSINIGRLVPQITYYVYAYARLVEKGAIKPGERINVAVPTGNFGNILAAYYAKSIGLPIAALICASNENKVLYDFFRTGVYDRNREFILTNSPSMDILISSNLERLIYEIAGHREDKNVSLMKKLSIDGEYEIDNDMKAKLMDFYAGFATEEQTLKTIKSVYEKTGYILDTHTAVAASVYYDYLKESNDIRKTLIVSTASPYKFARSVLGAIDIKYDDLDEFELIDELSRLSGIAVPPAVEEIRNANILHDTVCETAQMQAVVEKILGI